MLREGRLAWNYNQMLQTTFKVAITRKAYGLLNGLRKRNDLQLTSALQSDTIHPKGTLLLMAASNLSSCTKNFSSSDGAACGMEGYL
jgi:hypothetical protein